MIRVEPKEIDKSNLPVSSLILRYLRYHLLVGSCLNYTSSQFKYFHSGIFTYPFLFVNSLTVIILYGRWDIRSRFNLGSLTG